MIVGGQTEARAQLLLTIIDYHEPFDQGLTIFMHEAKIQTWTQKSPAILICPRDFRFISNYLCDFVNLTDIIPAIRTNHAAISLSLGETGETKDLARG